MNYKLLILIGGAVALLALAAAALWTVTYQGHRVLLSYPLYDFGVFKNRPNNISAWQARRVERLLLEAPIARRYSSAEAMVAATSALQFPGYGSHAISATTSLGERLTLVIVEIPRTGRERGLLFKYDGDALELLDDFVVNSEAFIRTVDLTDGSPVYKNQAGVPATVQHLRRRATL